MPTRNAELTWYASAQGDERNGGDRIFKAHRTAEMRGEVTDNCSQKSDYNDARPEANPAV